MICPNCQTLCEETDLFCYRCGASLQKKPPKKGTHLVPVLVLALLSVLGIVLFFLIPLGASPASDTPWFSVHNGALSFDEALYTGGPELVIPETVNGQTVLSIGADCFAGCTQLTSVELPDTVEIISRGAFSDCTSLRGIFLPEGVLEIGPEAFRGCTVLEAVSIPSTVYSVGFLAFDGCAKLFYIFYNGKYTGWEALYTGYITPYTQVSCTDGIYRHR